MIQTTPVLIKQLIPTHNRLRDPESVNWWRERFRRGHYARTKSPIMLVYFGGDDYLLHDGHHYAYGLYLEDGPEGEIHDFEVLDLSWVDYTSVNFAQRFVTPFDPRTEVRLPDFFDFKTRALDIYADRGKMKAERFIRENGRLFKEPRIAERIMHMSI